MNAEDINWNQVKVQYKIGQEVEGRVTAKTPAGDLIDINAGFATLLEADQMPELLPGQSASDLNPVGSAVKARIAAFVETPEKQIRLTQKP